MTSLREVADDHTGRVRTTLLYAVATKSVVNRAKAPGFSEESWKPLRDLVVPEKFIRVGNFKEVMRWDEYVAFLTSWAPNAEWDCTFKRVTEHDGLVFLELEEHSTVGEFHSVVNSISVYEFDADDRITRIDLYLQMALPATEMLEGYEGVEISG